jgi:hypothetical protein
LIVSAECTEKIAHRKNQSTKPQPKASEKQIYQHRHHVADHQKSSQIIVSAVSAGHKPDKFFF